MDHPNGTILLYNIGVLCNMGALCNMDALCDMKSALRNKGAPCNVRVCYVVRKCNDNIPMQCG